MLRHSRSLNTLVTLIRQLTKKNSVHVCGPTGSVAFNAGGITCQKLFHMPVFYDSVNMNATSLKCLMEELEDTVAIIIDECSMVHANVLGMMEQYSRQAAFLGKNPHLSWGGISIILIIGHDYQLPSIEERSFFCFGNRPNTKRSPCKEFFIQHGFQQFLDLGNDIMQLTSPKRVHDDQPHLKSILHGLRGTPHSHLSAKDAIYLCSFHLHNKDCFNSNDIKKIKKMHFIYMPTKNQKIFMTTLLFLKPIRQTTLLPNSKQVQQN
jgi:hypothetical protein